MLNRRKWLIIGIFGLIVVLAALFIFQMTPLYTATARVLIDSRQNNVVDVEAVLSGVSNDTAAINSEIDIIKSRQLLKKVADRLDLYSNPLTNPELNSDARSDLMATVKSTVLGPVKDLLGKGEAEELTPEEQRATMESRVLDNISSNLEVTTTGVSSVISISYTSPSPRLSSQIANTVADQYLVDQLEAKFEATRRANEWLSERLKDLRTEVESAEQAVRTYREENNLIQTGSGTVNDQQLASINAELVVARVALSQAEARYRGARSMAASGSVEGIGDVLASPLIQQLRQQESDLRRQQAELSGRYGPRHPEMLRIKSELQNLEAKIQEEVNRIVQSMANEVEVARAKVTALENSLDALENKAGTNARAEVQLNELERQAESARTLYESFLGRFRETSSEAQLATADGRIIESAVPPLTPSAPQTILLLALSCFLGLAAGLGVAVLLELLDRGFRTADQLERSVHLPVLSMVPIVERGKGNPVEYVVKKPVSAYAEAVRNVRTALQLSNVDKPPRIVLVTSSVPKEGKSTFSASLARLSALSGSKTLLIDGDLRRPMLGRLMDHEAKNGLPELLAGRCALEDALLVDGGTGLHLLLNKPGTPNPSDLLSSRRMADLLKGLGEIYDLVIIDSPPSVAVADSGVLGHIVDAVVYLVRWGETPRETVYSGLRQLGLVDVHPTGVVFSQVNLKEQAYYGYGEYGYYYSRYSEYYVN